jgi:hypothetical protein
VQVAATVAAFQANNSLAGKPLYFQAFSSGGTMTLKLISYLASSAAEKAGVAHLKVDGIISVDAAPAEAFGAWADSEQLTVPYYPPTLWLVMEVSGRWSCAFR